MNRTILFLLFSAMFVGFTLIGKAQSSIAKNNFLIGLGWGAPHLASPNLPHSIDSSNHAIGPFYLKLGFAFSKNQVIGLYAAFSRQSATYYDTTYISGPGPGIPGYLVLRPAGYSAALGVLTGGIEYAYHFGKLPKFSPYFGGMLGYTHYILHVTGETPNGAIVKGPKNFATYQLYIGGTYYFVKSIGLEATLGYGNSYYASIGLLFKFGNLNQEKES
jgi:hypothetical protein